jgi:UDP-2,3-diacylglucosamine pyrophosphatase LpxH
VVQKLLREARKGARLIYLPGNHDAHKVKNAVNYIGAFEQTLAEEAQRRGVDGVICGHIHHAVIHDNFGIRYVWVESCSALVEHEDGRFEIITWFEGAEQPLSGPRRVEQDEEDTEIAAWIEVGGKRRAPTNSRLWRDGSG